METFGRSIVDIKLKSCGHHVQDQSTLSDDQGRIFGKEIVLSTPNAKFHFFFNLKNIGISFWRGITSFGAEF